MAPAPSTQSPAIELRGVVRRYGDVHALEGLDLRVEGGVFYGLLGPNGAGKTTTVSILTTQARPDAGAAHVLGHDVVRDRESVRGLVGIVFQEPTLDRDLTPREQLDLHARLYHLPDARARVARIVEVLELGEHADRPVRTLSGGLRRRVEIARGLLHEPRVLFLDEPTVGLDPAARAAVWRHLRAVHGRGDTTIFLTTHSMEEADALCDRVGIVDRGRLVVEGSPEELKAALGGDQVALVLERDGALEGTLAAAPGVVRVLRPEAGALAPDSGDASRPTRVVAVVRDAPRHLAALLDVARPFGILEVTLRRPTLEDVFLHHTGHPFEPELAVA